jgi:hypothetical protein
MLGRNTIFDSMVKKKPLDAQRGEKKGRFPCVSATSTAREHCIHLIPAICPLWLVSFARSQDGSSHVTPEEPFLANGSQDAELWSVSKED